MRTRVFRAGLAFGLLVGVLGSAGCDVEAGLEAGLDALDGIAADKPAGSGVESLAAGEGKRIYYQFVDDRNQVRFVTSLDLVPAAWRERVGYVELAAPPPMAAQDQRRAQQARALRQGGPQILLYGADWCSACRSARRYMDSEGIGYEMLNVDEPRYEARLFEVSGARSIPVFDIDGSILSGFDRGQLDRMIEAAS